MVESMTTPMKKEMKGLNYTNSLRHAHTSGKKRDDLPKDANSMYASYTGTYSKNYKPSYDGTFRERTTMAASVFTGQTVTREEHNQQGLDVSYKCVEAKIPNPVPLKLTRPRQIFHRRDGAMLVEAHENRFLKINDLTLVNSKFRKYQSPGFQNWADHSLDEFIKNPSNSRHENVNHIFHDVNHAPVQVDLSAGLPDFKRYITRDQNLEKNAILGMKASPAHYDQRKVSCGFHQTQS